MLVMWAEDGTADVIEFEDVDEASLSTEPPRFDDFDVCSPPVGPQPTTLTLTTHRPYTLARARVTPQSLWRVIRTRLLVPGKEPR